MAAMDLHKQPVSKYYQIMQEIVARIRSGELPPGALIPSENDIIALYNVSNTTARKALFELESAGWVSRVKGKGTYVLDNRVNRSATRILGFTRNMIESGRKPETKLLSARSIRNAKSLTVNGRCYNLRGPVAEIKRLRLADGIPMMRETRYVSERMCPGILQKNLERSLYDIYENEYHLELIKVDQDLSAMIVDAKDIGFTEVSRQIPAFCVEGVTFCGREMILEMEESMYRGDMYRFSFQATR
jgi:GntR family transcriptional regulator